MIIISGGTSVDSNRIQKRISSMAVKVMIRNSCSKISPASGRSVGAGEVWASSFVK